MPYVRCTNRHGTLHVVECAAWVPQRTELDSVISRNVLSLRDLVEILVSSERDWKEAASF